MGKLRNFECRVEPDATLFKQEVDVIVEVIEEVMKGFVENTNRGTCIIDGQKYGEDADLLIRFNLSDGSYTSQFPYKNSMTSDEMAEEAINNALIYPNQSSRYAKRYSKTSDTKMESGVYEDEELKVFVLNATYGRFLISFYAKYNDNYYNTAVATAISEALAWMSKEDPILQKSAGIVMSQTNLRRAKIIDSVVKELFKSCRLPALIAWKEWHEPANNSGELELFFK